MNSSGTLEKILMGAGALIVGLIVLVMLDDSLLSHFMGKKKKSSAPEIGFISRSRQDVRRRLVDDLSWSPLNGEEKVYEGDTVFTGDSSEAQVVLNQGSQLDIAPNSLVVLMNQGGQMSLDVQYGTLTGNLAGNQTLKLKINGQETELKGSAGSSQIKIRADGQIDVLQGEVTVQGQKLGLNDKFKNGMKQDRGPASGLPTNIKLLEPADAAVVFLDPGQPLTFHWQAPKDETRYMVEVAQDPLFKKTIWRSQETIAKEALTTKLTNAGPVYWRVQSLDTGTATRPQRMGVFANKPVTLVTPKADEEILIPKAAGIQARVRFLWKDPTPSRGYRVELSRESAFKTPMVRASVRTQGVDSQPLQQGDYYWRVMPLHPSRPNAPWSAGHFKLTALALKKLPAPKQTISKIQNIELEADVKDKDVFGKLSLKDKKAMLKKNLRNPAVFNWQPVEGAEYYKIEVTRASDPDFDRPIIHEDVEKGTRFVWKQTAPGSYIWRVRAVDEDDRLGESSKVEKLIATVAPPNQFAIKEFVDRVPTTEEMNKPLKEMNVKWQPVVYAENYEMQLANGSDFQNAQTIVSANPELAVTPNQLGASYFRVRPLNSNKQPIGRYSAPQTLQYVRKLELEPPPIIRPMNDSSLVFVGSGQTDVLLNWDSVRGANKYEYEVAKDRSFSEVFQKGEVKSQRALVNSRLSSGKYFWRVKAVGSNELQSPWQDPAEFNISSQNGRAPASRR